MLNEKMIIIGLCHGWKSEELWELSGLEPVSLMIKKSRLRWFGHDERKDDNDWVKRCMTWEVEVIRQRGRPKKTWRDCVVNDTESLGLSQKDTQFRNKWTRWIVEKWPLKRSVFVDVGMRHPVTNTVSRTIRVLNMLLTITAKSSKWWVVFQLCDRLYCYAMRLSDAFVWRLSVCLTSVAYIGPKSRTERPRKTKIGTEVGHVTCDSDTTFR